MLDKDSEKKNRKENFGYGQIEQGGKYKFPNNNFHGNGAVSRDALAFLQLYI